MLPFLSQLWARAKNYVAVVAIVVSLTLVVVFKLQANADVKRAQDAAAAADVAHQIEIKKITDAHTVEDAEHAKHITDLESKLKEVEAQFEAAKIELDAAKRIEIKKIVEDYGNDPIALAQRLSEATGISIYPPANASKKK